MKTKIVNGFTKFYNDNDKYLMSYSTMSKPFTQDKFDSIPSFILEKATKFGADMSNLIVEAFGSDTIGEYTPEHLKCLKSLLNALKTLNLTPTTIEKHIFNEKWHGYLDIDCQEAFVEVKTRSKLELELNTIIQCEIYRRITNKDYYVIYLNKKTGEYKTWYCKNNDNGSIEYSNPTMANMSIQAARVIDAFETIYNLLS